MAFEFEQARSSIKKTFQHLGTLTTIEWLEYFTYFFAKLLFLAFFLKCTLFIITTAKKWENAKWTYFEIPWKNYSKFGELVCHIAFIRLKLWIVIFRNFWKSLKTKTQLQLIGATCKSDTYSRISNNRGYGINV